MMADESSLIATEKVLSAEHFFPHPSRDQVRFPRYFQLLRTLYLLNSLALKYLIRNYHGAKSNGRIDCPRRTGFEQLVQRGLDFYVASDFHHDIGASIEEEHDVELLQLAKEAGSEGGLLIDIIDGIPSA
ncbi:hypothetical protein NEOLI_003213 [Neolecta irregularis DAH-3]|uniref:Uncharacterized protein n=1 Tax=Neolecta irregularis (strain DAH-3) TaxID=1198029 RepID=A0A1U7LR93_NEOID|nr:hypothetical protein NEOLI_003213 [Neolecta irregularis DAH-3]|eukprot:OLL25177.1 hypothetical protein NEOLI_003213 [Neolecta irregularis DAH-3]